MVTTLPTIPPMVMISSPISKEERISCSSFWRFFWGRIMVKYISTTITSIKMIKLYWLAPPLPEALAPAAACNKIKFILIPPEHSTTIILKF